MTGELLDNRERGDQKETQMGLGNAWMYVQNSGKGMRVLCPEEKVHHLSQMLKGTVSPPDFRSAIPEVGDEMTWPCGVGSDAEAKADSRGSW